MPAAAGENASDDDNWGDHADHSVPDLALQADVDVSVVVDSGRPTALRRQGLLLPVTRAVRWHERPVIPWWRSQRRLDFDQALALVDQERWRLQAEVPPPAPILRRVSTPTQPAVASERGTAEDDYYAEPFEVEPGDLESGDAELDGIEPEPATVVVEVLRAGEDWHVLRVEGP